MRAPQQLYDSNSGIKYPFSDTHTEDVPNDIVLDMSLSVPRGVIPVVTVIAVTETYFFMALEDSVSEDAIGHIIVNRPLLGKIYEITTTLDNSFGWLVLGPGRNTIFENRELSIELDKGVVLEQPTTDTFFNDLQVNGFPYTDIVGNLAITANNPYVVATLEEREITGLPGEVGSVTKTCLVLSRNDTEVPVTTIYGGLVQQSEQDILPATSVAGVKPDETYNVEISSSDMDVNKIRKEAGGDQIGLLLYSDEEACADLDPRRFFKHGRCDEGIDIPGGLPLDPIVEELNPQYELEDCGCDDSSSESD